MTTKIENPAVLVLAVSGVVAALLFRDHVSPEPGLHWDEAYHVLFALRIKDDVSGGHVLRFAYDTYTQVYWPFLHSWYVAAAFGVFGTSPTVARAASLAAYVASACLLFGTAVHIARPADEPGSKTTGPARVAGLLAAGSFVAARGVQESAPQAMLELPALLALVAGFRAYAHATGQAEIRLRAWVALGAITAAL